MDEGLKKIIERMEKPCQWDGVEFDKMPTDKVSALILVMLSGTNFLNDPDSIIANASGSLLCKRILSKDFECQTLALDLLPIATLMCAAKITSKPDTFKFPRAYAVFGLSSPCNLMAIDGIASAIATTFINETGADCLMTFEGDMTWICTIAFGDRKHVEHAHSMSPTSAMTFALMRLLYAPQDINKHKTQKPYHNHQAQA
jgi:hypothetical protein